MGDPPVRHKVHLWLLYGGQDSHPFILHRMMQCRSSPSSHEGPPSRCLDPTISVSPWRRVVVVKTLRIHTALTFAQTPAARCSPSTAHLPALNRPIPALNCQFPPLNRPLPALSCPLTCPQPPTNPLRQVPTRTALKRQPKARQHPLRKLKAGARCGREGHTPRSQ